MKALITQLVSLILSFLIDKIDNGEIVTYGERAGKFLTDNCRSQMGDSWERIEEKLQGKLAVFMGGLNKGLDYDD